MQRPTAKVRLSVPSKGRLEQQTLDFLASAGLKVNRTNERQYIASIRSVPQIEVLFQRAADIVSKVDEGSAALGITGYDIVSEQIGGYNNIVVIAQELGYGKCELVLAVPEGWLDVSSVGDLAEVAVRFKEKGRTLRIATKHPNLTKQWLYEREIIHFSLVSVEGAIEAAPTMGYADIIADISSSGTTLRENRLKTITDGSIIKSQTCLIGNRKLLLEYIEDAHGVRSSSHLDAVRMFLEFIEAYLRSRTYLSVTANMCGEHPEDIARMLNHEQIPAGLHGPTISKVYPREGGEEHWYAVTIVIEDAVLMNVIQHLRKAGGRGITVFPLNYLFHEHSWHYEALIETLKREQA
jgi:ATP phosphoribosyltransferase